MTWDLESLFPGGSQSPAFGALLATIEREIAALIEAVGSAALPTTAEALPAFSTLLQRSQNLSLQLLDARCFVACLTSQDVTDEAAQRLEGRVNQLTASYLSVSNQLDERVSNLPDDLFTQLIAMEQWDQVALTLQQMRELARERMSPAMEGLANDLAVDGLQAWESFRNRVVGRMTIELEVAGERRRYSMGQALQNLLFNSDRELKAQGAALFEAAFASEAELLATVYNNLVGFRLALYRQRGWTDVLHESLRQNWMSRPSLDAMWAAVSANRAPLVQGIYRHAQRLGLPKLEWYDMWAPFPQGSSERKIPYAEAVVQIPQRLATFSPKMAAFVREAVAARWIEAENRPGKLAVAFCAPIAGQSRVFMTFAENPQGVATLAHELGHAFHHHVMRDLPAGAQNVGKCVAETASTIAEVIVMDAAIQEAPSDAERISLLARRAHFAIRTLLLTQSRFEFERRFYAERAAGPVALERLKELLIEARREAVDDAQSSYFGLEWASLEHYTLADAPFYNYPYTAGYLFALGIYAQSKVEGAGFEERFIALLRDSGRMPMEALAELHLGVDLTQPTFWEAAVGEAVRHVEAYLSATA